MFSRAMAASEAPGNNRPAAANVCGTSTHNPSPSKVNPSIPTRAGATATTANPSAATTSRTTATAPNRRTPKSPTARPTSVITM